MYSTYSNSFLDSCEFSDAESVVDSLIDSFGNSPAPSIDSWCEQTLHEIDTDIDFQELLANPLDLSYPYQFESNSPLNLPMSCNQQMMPMNTINSNAHNQSINMQQQQHLQHQPLQQQLQQRQLQEQQQQQQLQQQRNLYQQNLQLDGSNIYNTFNNIDPRYVGNCSPPHPSHPSLLMQQQTNNNNNNNRNNVTAFEEMFREQIEMFNVSSLVKNSNSSSSNENDVFNLNQSTMDNKSQILFLDLIKQQQQHDLASNQSSPPPTPSSDWADIPSPCSPIRHHIKSEYGENKDSSVHLKRQNAVSTGSLDEELNFPSSDIKISDIKKELQVKQPAITKPKRKRASRKQYTPNSDKPRLYKFLRQILGDPETYRCIEWVDQSVGTFKFLDSSEVARLWGLRKNKPSMKYENFARSLRTYIAKGILKKPRNKLVYCFAQPNE